MRTLLASYFEEISKTGSRGHPNASACLLQYRIGCHCATVREVADIAWLHMMLRQKGLYPANDGCRRISGRGVQLERNNAPVFLALCVKVCEGTAYVDP
jgi:hypothetical protein